VVKAAGVGQAVYRALSFCELKVAHTERHKEKQIHTGVGSPQ